MAVTNEGTASPPGSRRLVSAGAELFQYSMLGETVTDKFGPKHIAVALADLPSPSTAGHGYPLFGPKVGLWLNR